MCFEEAQYMIFTKPVDVNSRLEMILQGVFLRTYRTCKQEELFLFRPSVYSNILDVYHTV